MGKVLHFIDKNGRKHYKNVNNNDIHGNTIQPKFIGDSFLDYLIDTGASCNELGFKKGVVTGRKYVSIEDIVKSINLSNLSDDDFDNINDCVKWSADVNDDGIIDETDIITLMNISLFYQTYGCRNPSSTEYYCNTHDCDNIPEPMSIPGFDGWENNQTSTRTNQLPNHIVNQSSSCISRNLEWLRGCRQSSNSDDFYTNIHWGCTSSGDMGKCDSCDWIDDFVDDRITDCCYNYPHYPVNNNGQPPWYRSYSLKYGVSDETTFTSVMYSNLKIDDEYVGYSGNGESLSSHGHEWINSPQYCCESTDPELCSTESNLVSNTIFNKVECYENGFLWISDSPYDVPVIGVFIENEGDEIDDYSGCRYLDDYVNIDCSNIVGILPKYKSSTWYPDYNIDTDVNPSDLPPLKFQYSILEGEFPSESDMDDDITGEIGGIRYPYVPYGQNNPVYILDVDLPSQGTHKLLIKVWNPKDEQIYHGGCWLTQEEESYHHGSIQHPGLVEINTEQQHEGIVSGCPIESKNINGIDYDTCNYDFCGTGCYGIHGDDSCCQYEVCHGINPVTDNLFECVPESEINDYPWKWTYYSDCDGDGMPCSQESPTIPSPVQYCIDSENISSQLCDGNPPILSGVCLDDDGNIVIGVDGLSVGCDFEKPLEITTLYCTFMNNGENSVCEPIEFDDVCECADGIPDSCGVCGGTAVIGPNEDYTAPDGITKCNYDPSNHLGNGNILDCNCDCSVDDDSNYPRCIDSCGICRNAIWTLEPSPEDSPDIFTCYEDQDNDGESYIGAPETQCCPIGHIEFYSGILQIYCQNNPSCRDASGNIVDNYCNVCESTVVTPDAECPSGLTITEPTLPSCNSPFIEEGEPCESDDCASDDFDICGICQIYGVTIPNCLQNQCSLDGDETSYPCVESIDSLLAYDDCYIPGVNTTCMVTECNNGGTQQLINNPCDSCVSAGTTSGLYPGNDDWNASCADCNGYPCKSGLAAYFCLELGETEACSYLNIDPNDTDIVALWGGKFSYGCEYKKDATGNNCCHIDDVDECDVCNGVEYEGKKRWWADFDGDGNAFGSIHDVDGGGYCGQHLEHEWYIGDGNLYLHPGTPPPDSSVPGNSNCILSGLPCYTETCNECIYWNELDSIYDLNGNLLESVEVLNNCDTAPLRIGSDDNYQYLTCIDDHQSLSDCHPNYLDTCHQCCNQNYCADVGGCAGSGIDCQEDSDCPLYEGIQESCVYPTHSNVTGPGKGCYVSDGSPSINGNVGPNWNICQSLHNSYTSDDNDYITGLDQENVLCNCLNQGCGCNWRTKQKYCWDLDGDGLYGIDNDYYYCEDDPNIPDDFSIECDLDADINQCQLINYDNYLCCTNPEYCYHEGVVCTSENCNSCNIYPDISDLLNSFYCNENMTEIGCNCLNIGLTPINHNDDILNPPIYYTITDLSLNNTDVIKIKIDMEVPSGYEFDSSYDSYIQGENEIEVRLRDINNNIIGTSSHIYVMGDQGIPNVEFDQESLGLSVGTYVVEAYYPSSSNYIVMNEIQIELREPIYGCTQSTIFYNNVEYPMCNSPELIYYNPQHYPTHDTSCPPDDPNCPNNGSSCISPKKYYPDNDGDGIPCCDDDFIWACPSFSEMQIDIENDIYPEYGIIGWNGVYPGCNQSPQTLCPITLNESFTNITYGMITLEPTPSDFGLNICGDSVSSDAFCWNFNYNSHGMYTYDGSQGSYSCMKWEGGDTFDGEGDWVLSEHTSVLEVAVCYGYPYAQFRQLPGEPSNCESGQYCGCSTNIFDDCGVCISPECVNVGECVNNETENPNIACNGNLIINNPCSQPNQIPSNPLWNTTCTGCTDPSATNYNESAIIPCSGDSYNCMGECSDPDDISPDKKLPCTTTGDCYHNGNDYGVCEFIPHSDTGIPFRFYNNPSVNDLNEIPTSCVGENISCNDVSIIPFCTGNNTAGGECLVEEGCVGGTFDCELFGMGYDQLGELGFCYEGFGCISTGYVLNPDNNCDNDTPIYWSQESADNFCIINGYDFADINCDEVLVDDYAWNMTGLYTMECIESTTTCNPNTFYIRCVDNTADTGNQGSNCCCEYDYGCVDTMAPNYNTNCGTYGCSKDCEGNDISDCLFATPYGSDVLLPLGNLSYMVPSYQSNIYFNVDSNELVNIITDQLKDKYIKINQEIMYINSASLNTSNSIISLNVNRGAFDTNIITHPINTPVYLESDGCNYNDCCVNYKVWSCTDSNAINYYCSDGIHGYVNERLCPDNNLPTWDDVNQQTGHIMIESCTSDSFSYNSSCGQYRYSPLEASPNIINSVKGNIQIDGPNNNVTIGEGEFTLASTWQGFPIYDIIQDGTSFIESGTRVSDNNVHWQFAGWNNNFDQRFGEGNWYSFVVDVTNSSPVPGLTKALRVQINDYDDICGTHPDEGGTCPNCCGWGGLTTSNGNFNNPENYFSAWVRVHEGEFQFGHLSTSNRLRVGPTNDEWVFVHTGQLDQIEHGINHNATQSGLHMYANARNNPDKMALFDILLLHVTNGWDISTGIDCCCEYKYDCNNRMIEVSDIEGPVTNNPIYNNENVAYYDGCGICSEGTSDHEANTDSKGCGCFKGNTPTWYYDYDCPNPIINESGYIQCDGNGEPDGYGCVGEEYTMTYSNPNDTFPAPIWPYCLPEQGGNMPFGYIHPSTMLNEVDWWWNVHPGWLGFEESQQFCNCGTNQYDCTGMCVDGVVDYLLTCDRNDYPESLCNDLNGDCKGCDNCGLCNGPNRDALTCENDPNCEEEWLWPSITEEGKYCNWYPDNISQIWDIKYFGDWPDEWAGVHENGWYNYIHPISPYTGDYDCNCECGGTAYINDCGYCVEGNTGRSNDHGLDDCGICNGINRINDEWTSDTSWQAFESNASGDLIPNLYCNYNDPGAQLGCNCECESNVIIDACGVCGGDNSSCTGCSFDEDAFNYGLQDCGDGVTGVSYLNCNTCEWIGTDAPGDGGTTIHGECLISSPCVDCSGTVYSQLNNNWRRLDPYGMCCTHPEGEWENYLKVKTCYTTCGNDYNSNCSPGYEMVVHDENECLNTPWCGHACGWSVDNCTSSRGQSLCNAKGCECKGYALYGHRIEEVDSVAKNHSQNYDSNIDYDLVNSRWNWDSYYCTGLAGAPCGSGPWHDAECKDCHGGDCTWSCTTCDYGDQDCSIYYTSDREDYWVEGNCIAFEDENDFTSTQLYFIPYPDGNLGKLGSYEEYGSNDCCVPPSSCCKIPGGTVGYYYHVCTSESECSNADGTIVDACDCDG